MNALGEWDDPNPAERIDTTTAKALVDHEVARQVRRQTRRIAEQAVSNALTPDVVEDLQDHAQDTSHHELTDPVEPGPPPLYYGSVDEFVREIVCPTFRRRVGERAAYRWAGDWWRNSEALLRLEAIWRAWEHLRLDPATGVSVWLRDHADPQLAVLMDPEGPFKYSTDSNQPGDPLPYTPPPPGLFPDVRQATSS